MDRNRFIREDYTYNQKNNIIYRPLLLFVNHCGFHHTYVEVIIKNEGFPQLDE